MNDQEFSLWLLLILFFFSLTSTKEIIQVNEWLETVFWFLMEVLVWEKKKKKPNTKYIKVCKIHKFYTLRDFCYSDKKDSYLRLIRKSKYFMYMFSVLLIIKSTPHCDLRPLDLHLYVFYYCTGSTDQVHWVGKPKEKV